MKTTIDYTGIEFLDYQNKKNRVYSFSEKFNAYLVCEIGREHLGFYDIMDEQTIEKYLSDQDRIKESWQNELERQLKAKQEKEAAEAKYNNTYGYADNFPPMKKGKVLKILNRSIYDQNYGSITRKEFIYNKIKEGYLPEVKNNVVTEGKKIRLERTQTVKAKEYRIVDKDNSFYVITKTEYDLAEYLTGRG